VTPLGLTRREVECLACAARGFTYAETARRLGVSVSRVDHLLAMARHKLGAASTTEAVAIATRRGVLRSRVA
jgi:DNA-binding CsgD family transcriptional regulator